jgi:hypothetical protein
MEVTGFPNYLVSTYGRVFSLRRKIFMKLQVTGGNAAPRIPLSLDGQVISVPLAPTVLTAFGRRPIRRNATPRWRDGDSRNCALSNLEWA